MPYKERNRRRAYQAQWIARRRADYLADKACVMCGSTEDLHMDHRDPFTKVSHRIWSWSQERRDAELAKCDVLCHRHHVEKTNHDGSRVIPAGEHHPFAKLTEADVRQIRTLAANGVHQQTLASRYHVNRSTISLAVTRQTWAHLDAP